MADIHKFPDAPEGTPKSNFVHLHVHSDYSLLDGASKLDTLIARAKQLNMPALALTDHGNMFGVLNFEHICHANGINPIIGEEFYVTETNHKIMERTIYGNKYYHLILLCENEIGYKNMCYLSSVAYTEGTRFGKPRIDFEMLKERHEGLICLSACIQGQLPQMLLHGDEEKAEKLVQEYSSLFGKDHYYIELQDHGLPDQKTVAKKLIALAHKMNIPLVLTNDIHYCYKDDAEAQDALRCIGFQKKLYEPHQTMGDGRSEWYLKDEKEMSVLFPDCPEAISNTIKIANMCNLTIHQYTTQELKDCLPRFELPKEFQTHGADYSKNQDDYVRYLVEEGLKKRYKEITPKIRERAEYELGIIFKMGFSGYFLIVWEFINWAKSTYDNVNKKPKPYIPIGPGRGSGAGSLVAYCMTITDIDPFKYNLIFERFLNPERVSMPDFDIDMDFDYRQDIIQHTRDLYGDEKVGHIVTFGTLKAKQVIADVGRVLGLPLSEVAMLKKCIPDSPKARLADAFNPPTDKIPDGGKLIPYKDDERYKKLFELAFKLENVNRNTGLHASGMVIGLTALPDWAPVFMDPKSGEVGVQYTMDIIEPCGLVKFDYLGLKTLSLIRYAENIINKHKKPNEPLLDCSKVSETDKKTFDLFKRGDSMAVFQFESPGMQKILRQFQPEKLEDLVALNALYRPGPMDYIPNYINGKWKPQTIHYPDPCLEDILKETYGVMVYQEQVMQVSQRIAGFSLGEADMLRRAMGKKKPEVMKAKQEEFVKGAEKQGFSKEHAIDIFNIMIPFAGYGFNKSHAAAYSVLAYRTGWLKANYPSEFMAANLTNEINSTDGLPLYLNECRRMGLVVDSPDVNRSDSIFDVVEGHIVFGLCGIKGMGQAAANVIVKEREQHGLYKNFIDFLDRVMYYEPPAEERQSIQIEDEPQSEDAEEEKVAKGEKTAITKKTIEVLIKTGAFDKLGINRNTLLHNMESAMEYVKSLHKGEEIGQESLFDAVGIDTTPEFKYEEVEDLPNMEKLNLEKECIGCYVSGHPLDDYRAIIEGNATVTSTNIEREAKVAEEEKQALGGQKSWIARNSGKVYVAIGMLTEIKQYTNKKGEEMAFGKLQDLQGFISLTFFAKTWGVLRAKIQEGGVFAFKGKLDGSREEPSFLVTDIIEMSSLKAKPKAVSALHIRIDDSMCGALINNKEIMNFRDFLLDNTGSSCVYFHIGDYVVKASSQITISSNEDFIKKLNEQTPVLEVWTE